MATKVVYAVLIALVALAVLIVSAFAQSSDDGQKGAFDFADSRPQLFPAAPMSNTTTVYMFAYDDTNANGWRDPDEKPYLPISINAIYCYNFISAECNFDSGSYKCVIQGYDNTVQIPRGCPYTVSRQRAIGIFPLPEPFGSFTTVGITMSIYFPSGGFPDNLLGTPTPSSTPTSTSTPTPTPTTTPTPTSTSTSTSTPTPTVTPTLTSTPTPTNAGSHIYLPITTK